MNSKTQNILAIVIGLILVTTSNIIGHFAPPFSINASPILLPLIIAGVNYRLYKSNFRLTVVYNFALLLFNDLFIRFYAGGTHDDAGKTWVSIYFTVTFIIAYTIMTLYSIKFSEKQNKTNKKETTSSYILTILFLSIFACLLYWFVISNI